MKKRIGLGLLALTALLGSCVLDMPMGGPETATGTEGKTAKAGDLITVSIPLAGAGSGRSLTGKNAETLTDYYEVIFKPASGDNIVGTAVKGNKDLQVTVTVGETYDVLLLAGTKNPHVLLASAYNEGITISADETIIDLNLVPLTVGVGAYTFSREGADLDAPDSRELTTATPLTWETGSPDDNPITLTVTLSHADSLSSFVMATDDTGDGIKGKVVLSPTGNIQSGFYFDIITADLDSTSIDLETDDLHTIVFTFGNLEVPDTAITPTNVTGQLYFDITYYAFGDTDSKSSQWHIRNGLYFDKTDQYDANDANGAVLIQFGTGNTISDSQSKEVILPL